MKVAEGNVGEESGVRVLKEVKKGLGENVDKRVKWRVESDSVFIQKNILNFNSAR